jgi:hypothetical protein
MAKGNVQANESLAVTGMKFERLQLVVEVYTQGSCPTMKHVSPWCRKHKNLQIVIVMPVFLKGLYT